MAARAIAVLKMSHKVKSLITFAQSVAAAMTGNTTIFPSPSPTLATFQANIAALVEAETAVVARTKGAADTRNAKLAVVRADLESLKIYVQNVVDASNPANSPASKSSPYRVARSRASPSGIRANAAVSKTPKP